MIDWWLMWLFVGLFLTATASCVCCGCSHAKYGDTFDVAISDVVACPGFSITGINGTFTATWDEGQQMWIKDVIGTVTPDMGSPLDIRLFIQCVEGELVATAFYIIGPNYYVLGGPEPTGFLSGIPIELDVPADNLTDCANALVAAHEGTITVSLP